MTHPQSFTPSQTIFIMWIYECIIDAIYKLLWIFFKLKGGVIMKMQSFVLIMTLFVFLFGFLTANVIAQENFPSRDSKEWNDLTVAQRWQAVNIPEDNLSKMSTNDLIEHCVNFDFMWDVFNYPNYGIGLNVVIENHNGLRELLNRKDSGRLILDFYKKIDLNKITEISEPADRGEFVGKIFFLDLFLSHPNILNQFQGNEKELIKSILRTHDNSLGINAKTGKDFYCGYSISTKALLIGRALDHFKGRKTDDSALKEMDLSKLSNEKYNKIIQEARKL